MRDAPAVDEVSKLNFNTRDRIPRKSLQRVHQPQKSNIINSVRLPGLYQPYQEAKSTGPEQMASVVIPDALAVGKQKRCKGTFRSSGGVYIEVAATM